jgi:drug/metabolite transporter (DMT)-like permease
MLRQTKAAGIAFAFSSGVFFGTLSVFITLLNERGVTVWTQLTARLGISALIFLPLLLGFAPGSVTMPKGKRLLLLVNGGLMAAACTSYVTALAMGTPAAKAILLVYMYPIFVTIMGPKLLGERVTGLKLVGVGMGVFGAAVMMRFWDLQSLGHPQPGDLLAIFNSLLYASLLVIGRRSGLQNEMQPLAFTFWSFAFGMAWIAAAFLVFLAFRGGAAIAALIPGNVDLGMARDLAGLVVFGTALPYGLMYLGLKHAEVSTASVFLLVEPLSVLVLSALFLHQSIEWWNIVGGAIILAAGVLVGREAVRRGPPVPAA